MLQDAGSGEGVSQATTPDKSPVRRLQPSPIAVQAEPPGALRPQVSMSACSGKPCRGHRNVGSFRKAGDPSCARWGSAVPNPIHRRSSRPSLIPSCSDCYSGSLRPGAGPAHPRRSLPFPSSACNPQLLPFPPRYARPSDPSRQHTPLALSPRRPPHSQDSVHPAAQTFPQFIPVQLFTWPPPDEKGRRGTHRSRTEGTQEYTGSSPATVSL